MNQFAEYGQQLADLVHHLVPATAMPPALPTAIVTLIFGVTLCALGAKMARWFVTVTFAVAGMALGLLAANAVAGVSAPLGALAGALALGCPAFLFYRYLVGLFTGGFLAVVAFSVFSSQMVVPHLSEFDRAQRSMIPVIEEFHTGPAPGSPNVFESGWERFEEYAAEFSTYLHQHEPNLVKYGAPCVLGAGILGVLMGVFLCRLTLILFTAALGTSLIGSGLAVLGSYVGMDLYQTSQAQPEMAGIALLAFFLVSVGLQYALTRPEPSAGKPAAE